MTSDDVTKEMLEVLKEIRELLRPIADAHQGAYDRRLAIRAQLSSDKRRRAWALADGTLTQREISRSTAMDEGATSRFFKTMRDLGALTDAPNPTRAVEVEP